MTATPATSSVDAQLSIERSLIISLAVAAIVLGIIALVWPGITVSIVALLFGIFLVLSGILRIVIAFTATGASTGLRWFTGILGLLVVAAGIACLNDPTKSIIFIAYVIGFGWIFGGVADLLGGIRGGGAAPRALTIIGGVLGILAGIAIMLVPTLALSAFVVVGGILLIVVGIGTLVTAPKLLTTFANAQSAARQG